MHLDGKAADIVCSGKSALQLAQRAERLGMKGIEWSVDGNYTHIDTRTENGLQDIKIEHFMRILILFMILMNLVKERLFVSAAK